jgi:hypothetical protein
LIRATPSSPRSVTMSVAPVVEGELLPLLVPAHRDDALRAELLRRQDAEQADGTVADHRHRFARRGLGGDRGEPAGA